MSNDDLTRALAGRGLSDRVSCLQTGVTMACIKCGSENQNRVRRVVLVIKVERQRELEVTALHCQECGFLEISAPPDAIPVELKEPWRDRGRPN